MQKATLGVQTNISDVVAKAVRGERLSLDECATLMEGNDLMELAAGADTVRRKRHGNVVHYRNDLNINHTNVCVASCGFCAFYRSPGEAGGYTFSVPEILEKARAATAMGVHEWHIVGGLHPDLGIEYFEEMFRGLKAVNPRGFIEALTAVEIDYIAKKEKSSVRETLERLKAAGLDMLPGGGAEVFDAEARVRMQATKIGADRWLAVHEEAHRLGIPTNATMLYGHVEDPRERAHHMGRVRALQDKTGGFLAFVPLAFNPDNTALAAEHHLHGATGVLDMKVVAASRLFFDNVAHVKLPWVTVGKRVAQISLTFGVDDIGGSAFEERILEAAGGKTWQYVTTSDLPSLICDAGFEPALTNSDYSRGEPVAAR
ncbi:MAG: CofH family radical SAM protein [Euryarchaeota archaeon]|nr:CofH family radical SAM protein [Euryarchaeota archaeon]